MRILIIGHSVLDYVEYEGTTTIQPGGIFYTATGFTSQKSASDKFYLLTYTDDKTDKYFSSVFSQFDLTYSQKIGSIPTVHLNVFDDKEREERFENFSNELSIKHISNFKQFDGIFINMISGNDIAISDLEFIRKNYGGKIYLDVHALSKGTDEKGNRRFRKVPELERWLKSVNIIQANEFELDTISEGKDEFEKAKFVLELGPEILIITKGDKGVRAFYKNDTEIASIFLSAEKVNSVNKVGCGDIFGTYFFYSYIDNQNLTNALKAANKAGAIATLYSSTNNFINLKEDFGK